MQVRINISILIILSAFAGMAAAQPEAPSANDVKAEAATSLPYVGMVTGNNVYVRSGPGQNFYFCTQLNKGDTVTVVGEQFNWARIVPPPGSFSWISMRYVRVSAAEASKGTVTANGVRVYVGSEFFDPLRSDRSQVKLQREEEVELLGERKSDYYKISPPKGEYRWISRDYIEPISRPAPVYVGPNDTNVGGVISPNAAPAPEKLKMFYSLQERLDAERKKPIEQQNYASIKKQLSQLAEDASAGKAAKYAEYALKQVARCELALLVDRVVKQQDQQLKQVLEDIEKQKRERLADLPRLGRFAAMGKLLESNIFTADYRIVDEFGNLICYAAPDESLSKAELESLLGEKVGLIGQIKAHPETAGVLVTFTKIEKIR